MAFYKSKPSWISVLFYLVISLSFSCSEGLNFAGDKDRDDTSDDDGAELVSEPVMVGGAYLTCHRRDRKDRPEPDPDGSYQIGCRISSKATTNTLSLSRYNTQWVVMDNKRNEVQNVRIVEDNLSLPTNNGDQKYWHLVYGFPDQNFKNYNLEVSVVSESGHDNIIYGKKLDKFDEEMDRYADDKRFGLVRPDMGMSFFPRGIPPNFDFSKTGNPRDQVLANSLKSLGSEIGKSVRSWEQERQDSRQNYGSNYSNWNNYYHHSNRGNEWSNSYKSYANKGSRSGRSGQTNGSNSTKPPPPNTGSPNGNTGGNTSGNTSGNSGSGTPSNGNSGSNSSTGGKTSLGLYSAQWLKSGNEKRIEAFLDYAASKLNPTDCQNTAVAIEKTNGDTTNHIMNGPQIIQARPTPSPIPVGNPNTCILDRYFISPDKTCVGMFSLSRPQNNPKGFIVNIHLLRLRSDNTYGPLPTLKEFEQTKDFYHCVF